MRGRSSGKTGPPVPGLTRVGGGAIKSDGILFWGLDVERHEDPPFAKPPAAALRAAARHPA